MAKSVKHQFKGVGLLIFVILLYGVIALFDHHNASIAIEKSVAIFVQIIPILALVVLFNAIINYLLKPKQIQKNLGTKSGFKGLFYALLGGIFSHGPMYAWYGLLEELRNQGMRDGLIMAFLYARAIKLPLLPLSIGLFGGLFTTIMTLLILIAATLQSYIVSEIDFKSSQKKR